MKMADSGDSTVNLSALQRVDPYIVEIVDSASQVALYKFGATDNEWDKTNVEGSLFIYRRSAAPLYGLIIMNRLSKTNQVEPITKDLELQREDPYLLYRNSKLSIFGIWFYDRTDCAKISDMATGLLQKEKERSRTHQRLRRASESDSSVERLAEETQHRSVDILSMLSRAQDVYSKNKCGPSDGVVIRNPTEPKPIIESPNSGTVGSSELIRPKAMRMSGGAPDVTLISPHASDLEAQAKPLTVEALFASATKIKAGGPDSHLIGPTDSRRRVSAGPLAAAVASESQSNAAPALPAAPTAVMATGSVGVGGGGATNPLLQRLMSNPENLVEHIERRQRNEAPVTSRLPTTSATATTTTEELVRELQETLRLVATSAPNSRSTATMPTDLGVFGSMPLTPDKLLATSSGAPTVLTPAMLQSVSTSVISNSTPSHAMSTSASLLRSLQSPPSHDGLSIPFMFATPPKAAPTTSMIPLMSPMMFTTPAPNSTLNFATPPTTSRLNNGGFSHFSDGVFGAEGPPDVPISPLTKAQLSQAFSYLVRNDPEFVTKLHEAYIMSLNQLTSSHKT